LKMRE